MAGAVTPHAMHADLGLEVLLIAEIDQGVEVFDRLDDHIAAAPAITTIGPAIFDEFFAPEAYGTGATPATAHMNFCFVEKLHNRSFGRCPSIIVPGRIAFSKQIVSHRRHGEFSYNT